MKDHNTGNAVIKKGCVQQAQVKPPMENFEPPVTVPHVSLPELLKRLSFDLVNLPKSKMVPMAKVKRIAKQHASMLWGDAIACGEPLQIVDSEGIPISYAFPIAVGTPEILGNVELLKKFWKLRQIDPADNAPIPFAVKEEAKLYRMIYVSVRKSSYPVTRVSYAIHPYFYRGEEALIKLGEERTQLKRLTYLPPLEFFDFSRNDRLVRLHTDTMMTDEAILEATPRTKIPPKVQEAAKAAPSYQKEIDRVWKKYEDIPAVDQPIPPPPQPQTEFRIYKWERMPSINWTRWCEPTAASMVFTFWDHYVPVPGIGTNVGYERIVDFWHEHYSNGNNVPEVLEHIANENNVFVANTMKGYNWTVDKVWGFPNNDWGWSDLTGHLRANRPLVWQIHAPNFDHAVAVYGYREVFGQRYAILYTTWSADPELARAEWLYNEYAGNSISHVEVDKYVPGGKELNRAFFLRRPYGGETYHVNQWNEIKFYIHPQSDIEISRIEYSIDGGQHWTLVVEVWAQPGWNSWWWKPNATTPKARVRVRGLSANREYLAGSGSFENFTIE